MSDYVRQHHNLAVNGKLGQKYSGGRRQGGGKTADKSARQDGGGKGRASYTDKKTPA